MAEKAQWGPGEVAAAMIDAGELELSGKLLNELAASMPAVSSR